MVRINDLAFDAQFSTETGGYLLSASLIDTPVAYGGRLGMRPATNWRTSAESMLFTRPSPLASAPPGHGSEPTSPAVNWGIRAASIASMAALQSAATGRALDARPRRD